MTRKKKRKGGAGAGAPRPSSGGVMNSLLRGFKTVARGGASRPAATARKRTIWDVITWVLLVGAVVFGIYKLYGTLP